MGHAKDVVVTKVTFFGSGGPTSAELVVSVDEAPRVNPGTGGTVFDYKVANLSATKPGDAPRRQVYKAARMVIEAYMLGERRVTLDYVPNGVEWPWLTKISFGAESLVLEPGPIRS